MTANWRREPATSPFPLLPLLSGAATAAHLIASVRNCSPLAVSRYEAAFRDRNVIINAEHCRPGSKPMKIKAVVHEAEEGGFWAEVPALPGCATQGETMDELMVNLHEAIEACLSVEIEAPHRTGKERILEIAL